MAEASSQRSSRPTHFVAFQINNPDILKNFQRFFDDYFQTFPNTDLKDCAVKLSKSHLTLRVLVIPEDKELEAIEAFKTVASKYITAFQNVNLLLFDVEIKNISGDNKLIHADCDPNGHKAKIKNLCRDLTKTFRERGYEVKDDPLFLHCSLFNSKIGGKSNGQRFRLPAEEYKYLKVNAEQIFGTQAVTSVQLLSMTESDGYYKILSEFEFNPTLNSYI